jgi:hypothetical protein
VKNHPDAMTGSHDSGKAAFEVGKGSVKVMVLSEEQVVRFLDPNDLLRELQSSFGALACGDVQCPPRHQRKPIRRGEFDDWTSEQVWPD